MRPTDLARRIGVSRVMMSRLVNAVAKENPLEMLTRIPGPESLRTIIRSAQSAGVPFDNANEASVFIEQFAALIQGKYGTRTALNAALGASFEKTRARLELASRYQIYKGMSQAFGVQSKAWVACMVNTPNKQDPTKIDVSTLTGATGLRKLRPDTPIQLAMNRPPSHWARVFPGRRLYNIEQYCENPVAPLQPFEANGLFVSTFFAPSAGAKDKLFDMLFASYSPKAQNKFLDPKHNRRGASIIPSTPSALLHIDFIVHKDIYPGLIPELFVYNTNGIGKVPILDTNWSLHRLQTDDAVEYLGSNLAALEGRLRIPEMPGYVDIVKLLCNGTGYAADEFRVYRLRVQYPIFGTQYMVAFKIHEKPVPH